MKKLFIFLLTAVVFQINGQTLSEIISKINESNSNHNTFSVNILYGLYKNNDRKPTELKRGILYTDKNAIYSKIGELEMVSTSGFVLKINHKEKAMLLMPPQKKQASPFYIDLTTVVNMVDAKLIDAKDNWKIVLEAKEISQFPYSKVELYYNKKTLLAQKQVLTYFNQYDFNTDKNKTNITSYKLVIKYSHYKFTNVIFPNGIFNANHYYSIFKNKPRGINMYKTFELKDLRQY